VTETEWTPDPRRDKILFASEVEIAWAAGLFEGEGCICVSGSTPVMTIAMADEDVVRRFAEIAGGPVYGPYEPSGLGKKPRWVWRITGWRWCLNVAFTLDPYLGERRRYRITEILQWQVYSR
jgi:hypothetical protein